MTTVLTLRRAVPGDCRLLWLWVNDPATRAASFDTADVPWPAHVAWFEARMRSESTRIFIAETDDGVAVGQVRFDVDREGAAEVDVSVDAAWRGRQLAADLLRMASDRFLCEHPGLLVAHVRPENVPSRRAFEKAGFQHIGAETVNGHPSIRYERKQDTPARR